MNDLTGAGPARTRALLGAGLVLVSCLSVQASAALASTLFDRLGAPAVAGLRQLCAALVLMVLVRPRVRGHTRQEWAGMVVYGAAMAVMNVAYYGAVGHLPLGVAATLLFLGPFVVAVASARTWREALLPAVGLVGVVLVTEPGGTVAWAGIAFGLLSALALACYTVFAQRVGRASSGLEGLAVSVGISAMLLLPFSLPAAPSANGSDWGLVAVSGIVGVALAFTLDFRAVKMAGARVVATLFSLDPLMGALIGALALAESLSAPVLVGMGLIVSAGAAATWRAERLPVSPMPSSTDRS
ncbi:EamA family transporter [Streptomyces sp. WAC00303]|uniref:EamA family transporter n=1 Tax=Streptomyces sp. WAC00303 TaxID=2933779 RepID=UPI00204D0E50|nr:EamA family transporter [Streptomyces sp. WAC00303]UPT43796.1 EamA family transporter [Streptomyces sp. WAC00303]